MARATSTASLILYVCFFLNSSFATAFVVAPKSANDFRVGAKITSATSTTTTSLSSSLFSDIASDYNYLLDAHPLVTQAVTASVLASVGDLVAQLQASGNNDDGTSPQFDVERTRRFALKGLGGGVIWAFWFAWSDQWTQALLVQELFHNTDDNTSVNLMTLLLSMGGGGDATVTTSGVVEAATTAGVVVPDVAAVDLLVSATPEELPSVTTASLPMSVAVGKTLLSILLEQFVAVPIIYTFWDIPVPTLLSKTRDNRSIPSQVKDKLPALLIDNAKVWTFANLVVYNSPVQYRVLVSSLADVVWQSILSGHVMADGAAPQEADDDKLLEFVLGKEEEVASAAALGSQRVGTVKVPL